MISAGVSASGKRAIMLAGPLQSDVFNDFVSSAASRQATDLAQGPARFSSTGTAHHVSPTRCGSSSMLPCYRSNSRAPPTKPHYRRNTNGAVADRPCNADISEEPAGPRAETCRSADRPAGLPQLHVVDGRVATGTKRVANHTTTFAVMPSK